MKSTISLSEMIAGFHRACDNLVREREQLNHMNFFPIADKDTGTNMSASFKKALTSLTPATDIHDFADQFSFALLENGHGNSGTILTLFFEGFAQALPASSELDAASLAQALQNGYKAAYEAVTQPREGTILTVMRKTAQAAASFSDFSDDAHLLLRRSCEEAHAALQNTPILNPAKTTDAGAYGFCLILDGLLETDLPPYGPFQTDGAAICEVLFRYCTEGVIELAAPAAAEETTSKTDEILLQFQKQLFPLGDCILLVQTGNKLKFHIHTAGPENVFSIAAEYGSIVSRKVDDML